MPEKKNRLITLFFPIFFELLFVMLTGMVDTLMLSSEGDQAVGAVGTANTYIGVFLIMFAIISSGMMAVMTQYIGARRPGVAQQAQKLGLLCNFVVGVVISAILVLGATPILETVGTARDLMEPARVYLQTVGMFAVCSALTPIFSSYLRAFGHTTTTMVGTVVANIVNVVLNAVFLYGLGWGVFGVALATGISRLVNLLWVMVAAKRRIRPVQDPDPLKNSEILGKIIRVGLPSAMESVLYNVAITIVISFLNQMDSTGVQVTARSYAVQVTNFSYCVGGALAQANAILVGWKIGANQLEECNRLTNRNALIGIVVGIAVAGVIALLSPYILQIFTDDPAMIRLVGLLLVVDIFLEIGRVANLVYGQALKTSGDAIYPMVIAVVFMFLCAAAGTWYFGIHLGWLAVGAYVGMALDECVRAVFMFLRWRRGVWKGKSLLNRQ